MTTTMRQRAERDAKHFFAVTHGTSAYRKLEQHGELRSKERCLRCEGDCCDPFDSRVKCHRCDGTGCEERAR